LQQHISPVDSLERLINKACLLINTKLFIRDVDK